MLCRAFKKACLLLWRIKVTRGWNKIFDCFDGQVHDFRLEEGEKPLVGDLKCLAAESR